MKQALHALVHWLEESVGLGAWHPWGAILAIVLPLLLLVAAYLFLRTRISYAIGPRHLKVTILGIPVRRVRFDNIRNIHTHRARFAERWPNVLLRRPDRMLVIERKRGLIRRLVITPEMRYVFKAELDRAIRAHLGLIPSAGATGDTTSYDKPASANGAEQAPPAPPSAPGS